MGWTGNYQGIVKGMVLADYQGGEKLCFYANDPETRKAIIERDPALLDMLADMLRWADEITADAWDEELNRHRRPKTEAEKVREQATRVSRKLAKERGRHCQECGTLCGKGKLHGHHITPLAQGGDNTPENIVLLCIDCHKAKHYGNKQGDSHE